MALSEKVFCAFCKHERRVFSKRHANWTNVLVAFFTASLVMALVWRDWNPRVVVMTVVFIVFSEVFLHVRWRMSLPCPHCDFDPLLYKTNRALAVMRVKSRLDSLKMSGQYLLKKNNPFQHLPTVKARGDEVGAKQKAQRLLSREV